MRVDGNSLPSRDGVFRVRKNFHYSKMLPEQRLQAGASEEILVICFEQMPGNDLKRGEVWDDLKIWYRKNRALADGTCDFGEKTVRIRNMLEHFNANCAVKLLILDRKNFFVRFGLAIGQSASLKNRVASWVHLQTQPGMAGSNEGRGICSSATSNIEDARSA